MNDPIFTKDSIRRNKRYFEDKTSTNCHIVFFVQATDCMSLLETFQSARISGVFFIALHSLGSILKELLSQATSKKFQRCQKRINNIKQLVAIGWHNKADDHVTFNTCSMEPVLHEADFLFAAIILELISRYKYLCENDM